MSNTILNFTKVYDDYLRQWPEIVNALRGHPFSLDRSQCVPSTTFQDTLSQMDSIAKSDLSSEEYEKLMEELRVVSQKHRTAQSAAKTSIDHAVEVSATQPSSSVIRSLTASLNDIDLNSIREVGSTFRANLHSLRASGSIDEFAVGAAFFFLFGTLKKSGLIRLVIQNENDLRKCLYIERLPEVDRWLAGADEIEDLLSEMREKEPKGELLETLPPKKPGRTCNWKRVVRGGGFSALNILFGACAVLACAPQLGGKFIAPDPWPALISTYMGLWDVYEAFDGK